MVRRRNAAAGLAFALLAGAAAADVRVGVTLSATGPAASLGIPTRNAIALLPRAIAGAKVEYVVLDDGSDPAAAVRNARKLVSDERVDVLLGSNTTPASLALVPIAAETGTPLVSLAGGGRIVAPMDAERRWVFKTPQNDALMAAALGDHMARHGVKTAGFIGFADAYGDGWLAEFSKAAAARGVKVVATERYDRADTSVAGQALKLAAARPDAVLVGGSGTPAVLPQRALVERGYRGRVYHTHGVTNPDFLRVGGKDVEGAILPAGPVVVAAQLPDDHPCKKAGLEFVRRYDAAYGAGTASSFGAGTASSFGAGTASSFGAGTASSFGAHAWDAGLLLEAAIPAALKKGAPGTREFRAALRDALEATHDVHGAHGVFDMTPTDHVGLDERARVVVTVRGGAWQLLGE